MAVFSRQVYLRTSGSTNDHAVSLSNNDPNPNICVYTFDQVSGRGQIGRRWYTGADKNLASTFSWQQPDIPILEQFRINMAFSMAVHGFVARHTGLDHLSIKWPNDIYFKNQKLAGILIQNVLKGAAIGVCHLGVGLNINELDFPSDLPNPVSLHQITGRSYTLVEMQHQLTEMVSQHLSKLQSDSAAQLKSAYEALLYRKGQVSVFRVDDRVVSGKILGTTGEGKLRLELKEGVREFGFREVGYVN